MESLLSAGCSQGGHRGFQKESDKEGEANILDVYPKVFALHSEEDIIEQFLINKSLIIVIAL